MLQSSRLYRGERLVSRSTLRIEQPRSERQRNQYDVHSSDSRSIGRKGNDVQCDRRSDAASCPQFFTIPETEDHNTVERVKTAAAEIGTRLRALRPDLWIIFANDHVEQFFHTAAPPFGNISCERAIFHIGS